MLGKLSVVVGAGVIAMSGFVSQASAECLTAKGKITNNGQPDGSTLGSIALNLGKEKFKCGIVGIRQFSSPPDFKHTVVCDNKASSDEAQAQVTFNTSFLSAPTNVAPCPAGSPGGPVSFSFEEISTPDPATARGAFQGVTDEGSIIITGDFNCDGGIVMKFNGLMCIND
jgi:hypothetical protein